MKRSIIFFFICFFLTTHLFSNSSFNKDIVLTTEYEGEGLPTDETDWLPAKCVASLERNLGKYFTIFDTENALYNNERVKNMVSSGEYEEDANLSNIDSGNWTTSTHKIHLKVRKPNDKYILTVEVTSLKNKSSLGTIVKTSGINAKPIDLYGKPGCLVNQITVELLQKLKHPISSIDKNKLLYGDDFYSNDELLAQLIQERKEVSKAKDDTEKELTKLKSSNQKEDQEKIKEYSELLKKLEKEVSQNEKEIERAELLTYSMETENTDENINKKVQDSNNSLDEWKRNNKDIITDLSSDSLFSTIDIIESLKRINLDLFYKQSIVEGTENESYEKAVEEEKDRIFNAKLRIGEIDKNGNMLPEVQEYREEEFNSVKNELSAKRDENIYKYENIYEERIGEIRKEIDKYKDFVQNGTLSTLASNELDVSIGKYNAKEQSWPLIITIKNLDSIIYQGKSKLPFKMVIGRNPSELNSDEYEQEVQFYQQIFSSRNHKYTFAVDYEITAINYAFGSTYDLCLRNFRFYDTEQLNFTSDNKIDYSKSLQLGLLEEELYHDVIELSPSYKIASQKEIEQAQKREKRKNKTLLLGVIGQSELLQTDPDGQFSMQDYTLGLNAYYQLSSHFLLGTTLNYGFKYKTFSQTFNFCLSNITFSRLCVQMGAYIGYHVYPDNVVFEEKMGTYLPKFATFDLGANVEFIIKLFDDFWLDLGGEPYITSGSDFFALALKGRIGFVYLRSPH